ncbi:hypothetical protein MSPP1_002025 [Malassezia sp. CBS 17886]|nr:hypothetical protein MSPP1_002025 [Malassezia sp. CBS 17886]
MHRGQGATSHSAHATALSDERTTPVADKPGMDASRPASRQNVLVGGAGNVPLLYSSPSPPPPAPISNVPAPSPPGYDMGADHTQSRTSRAMEPIPSNYSFSGARAPAPQSSGAMAAWSSMHQPAGLEPNTAYALERCGMCSRLQIHAAALALYNCAGEHLDSQSQLRPDEVYALLPIVSEINQELRTLVSAHDSRSGRDPVELAPYYPWISGNNVPAYWSGTRDERDARMGVRGDEGHPEDKGSVPAQLRRRSPTQNAKPGDRGPARLRHASGSDDVAAYSAARSAAMDSAVAPGAQIHPSARADMYAHQAAYGSHGLVPTKSTSTDSLSGQQTYVPKYRKRSRAPAPGGLHFAKLVRRRTVEYADAASGMMIPPVTIAELRASTNVAGSSMGSENAGPYDARHRSASSTYSGPTAQRSASGDVPFHSSPPQDAADVLPESNDVDVSVPNKRTSSEAESSTQAKQPRTASS